MRRLIVATVLLIGCQQGRAVDDWTLGVDGERQRPVRVPFVGLAELPATETTYTLRTTLPLSRGETAETLTLALDCFHGDIAARAGGEPLADLGDTGVGEHRWVIPETSTRSGKVSLELEARWSNVELAGIGQAPYLMRGIATAHGDVATVNRTSAIVALTLIGALGVMYTLLFVLERRRSTLAIAVAALLCAIAPLWQLGLLAFLPPRLAITAISLAVGGANIAILQVIDGTFDLTHPRWLGRSMAGACLVNMLDPISFKVALLGNVVLVAATASMFARTAFLATLPPGAPRALRTDALLMRIAMVSCAVVMLPDLAGLALGHAWLGGLHTISAGVLGFVIAMAWLLSRQFVARQRAVDETSRELRRQISERSRELAEALEALGHRGIDVAVDRTIDARYRIIRRIGAGGMGTVYEVVRLSDGKHLALKTLRGRADSVRWARFAREAQIAAGLAHPNLVPVIDLGISDGILFLVMPLVEGGSLEAHRSRFGDRRWGESMLLPIARSLAALHDGGIIHRDIKPANILLGDGVPIITDFGIAALTPEPRDTRDSDDDALARTMPAPLDKREISGTIAYMAPEQARGDAQTASDIFAFGLVAAELLTGASPFLEAPVAALLAGRAVAPPDVASVPGIIARCLELEPSHRPTAAELVRALA